VRHWCLPASEPLAFGQRAAGDSDYPADVCADCHSGRDGRRLVGDCVAGADGRAGASADWPFYPQGAGVFPARGMWRCGADAGRVADSWCLAAHAGGWSRRGLGGHPFCARGGPDRRHYPRGHRGGGRLAQGFGTLFCDGDRLRCQPVGGGADGIDDWPG